MLKRSFFAVIVSFMMLLSVTHADGQEPKAQDVDFKNAPVLFKENGKSLPAGCCKLSFRKSRQNCL